MIHSNPVTLSPDCAPPSMTHLGDGVTSVPLPHNRPLPTTPTPTLSHIIPTFHLISAAIAGWHSSDVPPRSA